MKGYVEELSFRYCYDVKLKQPEPEAVEGCPAPTPTVLCSRCVELSDVEGFEPEVIGESETHKCDRCGYLTPEGFRRETQAYNRELREKMRGDRRYDGRDFDTILEEHMEKVRARGSS